jgi:hypothetical protein
MRAEAQAILNQMQFPNQYDVIREEAERFRQLSPDQRLESLQGVIQMGLDLLEMSPHQRFDANRRLEREEQWAQAHLAIVR